VIVDEDIARVREAVDVADVVGSYVALKKQGTRLVGLCPFHAEKSPSFSVSPDKGVWYCFGCSAGGDAINFVREVEKVDFAEAVEILAAKTGISLRYTNDDQAQRRTARAGLLEAVEQVSAWCSEALRERPDAEPVRAYLASRGYGPDIIDRWGIGWAPGKVDVLSTVGVSPGAASQAGLLSEAGRFLFSGRLIFPILDPSGRVIALAGRRLDNPDGTPGHGPKYVNSPETSALYAKSKTLFGLDRAKGPIVAAGQAIICEGYTDVISLHEAGFVNAVAACGTALTEGHAQLLSRYARELVLAFDADKAGREAAARIHSWERQFGLVVKVLELPAGEDPDTVARSRPEELRSGLERAVTLLGFRVGNTLAGLAEMAPEERVLAARTAADLVTDHPDAAVRFQYLQMIASRAGVPQDTIRSGTGRHDPEPVDAAVAPSPPAPPVDLVGREALRGLAVDPAAFAKTLTPQMFPDPNQAAAAAAIAAHPDDIHAAASSCETEPAAAEVIRAAVADPSPDPLLAAAQLVNREAAAERQAIYQTKASGGVDDTCELVYVGELVAQLGMAAGETSRRAKAAQDLAEWVTDRRLDLVRRRRERDAVDGPGGEPAAGLDTDNYDDRPHDDDDDVF